MNFLGYGACSTTADSCCTRVIFQYVTGVFEQGKSIVQVIRNSPGTGMNGVKDIFSCAWAGYSKSLLLIFAGGIFLWRCKTNAQERAGQIPFGRQATHLIPYPTLLPIYGWKKAVYRGCMFIHEILQPAISVHVSRFQKSTAHGMVRFSIRTPYRWRTVCVTSTDKDRAEKQQGRQQKAVLGGDSYRSIPYIIFFLSP